MDADIIRNANRVPYVRPMPSTGSLEGVSRDEIVAAIPGAFNLYLGARATAERAAHMDPDLNVRELRARRNVDALLDAMHGIFEETG